MEYYDKQGRPKKDTLSGIADYNVWSQRKTGRRPLLQKVLLFFLNENTNINAQNEGWISEEEVQDLSGTEDQTDYQPVYKERTPPIQTMEDDLYAFKSKERN